MTTLGIITVAGTSEITVETDQLTAIENALVTWVRVGSRLDAEHVSIAREGPGADPMPADGGTWISIRIPELDAVSDDWIINRRTASGGIVRHVRGTRHPMIELTCRAGSRYGSRRPGWILALVTAAASLPSVAQVLRRAGVGVGTFGTVRIAESKRSGMFDPVATVQVEIHIMIDVAEPGREFRSVGVSTPSGAANFAQTVNKPV